MPDCHSECLLSAILRACHPVILNACLLFWIWDCLSCRMPKFLSFIPLFRLKCLIDILNACCLPFGVHVFLPVWMCVCLSEYEIVVILQADCLSSMYACHSTCLSVILHACLSYWTPDCQSKSPIVILNVSSSFWIPNCSSACLSVILNGLSWLAFWMSGCHSEYLMSVMLNVFVITNAWLPVILQALFPFILLA